MTYICHYKIHDHDRKRPWGGWETTYVSHEDPDFEGYAVCRKTLFINPTQMFSVQKHDYRHEIWTVTKGEATAFLGDDPLHLIEYPLKTGETIEIPVTLWHSIKNTGTSPLILDEVQFGIYLHEDDIVRWPSPHDLRTTDPHKVEETKAKKQFVDVQVHSLELHWG